MVNEDIQVVDVKTLSKVITTRKPIGLFMAWEDDCWVAVDNTTEDAWTEEFDSKDEAVRWLYGEYDVS